MRRTLGLVQVLALSVALGAMLAPGARPLVRAWSGLTIYPSWCVVVLGLGVAAAVVSTAAPAARTRTLAAAAGVTGVCAAQVAALGAWAHRHWLPAFGMGGGYAGEVDRLERLALAVCGAGAVAAVAAVAQLVVQDDWPRATPRAVGTQRVLVGGGVLVGVPLSVASLSPDLADPSSLGALTLVYAVPWGLSYAAAGWLSASGAAGVLAAAAAGATLSAVEPSMHLTSGHGRGVFAVVGAVAVALVLTEVGRARPWES